MRSAVRPLVGTWVRPNHLTSLRLATGFASAAALAVGSAGWTYIGAGVLLVSLFLDRADGELARQSGHTSRFGHIYDLVADGASNAAVFVGIGAGVARTCPDCPGLLHGALAGVSVVLAEALMIYLDTMALQKSSELGGRWGFDPNDAMFLVPLALVLGAGGVALSAAAFGGPLAVVALAILAVYRIRRQRKEAIQDAGNA